MNQVIQTNLHHSSGTRPQQNQFNPVDIFTVNLLRQRNIQNTDYFISPSPKNCVLKTF